MTDDRVVVQAVHGAARVPGFPAPHDTVHVTVRHPTGSRPGSLPVVVIAPGTNVEPGDYRWLASLIARHGFAVATYAFVGPVPPLTPDGAQAYGLTPGIDLDAVTPEGWGRRPVSPVVPVVLDLLARMNDELSLGGALDLDRVALGGHSAGGTVALELADHRVLPQVRAAFAYGGHTLASTLLGWPPDTVLPLSGDCPVLLVHGSRDAVLTGSDPVGRTFATLGPDAAAGSWLVRLDGGTHHMICEPEPRQERSDGSLSSVRARTLLGRMLTLFLQAHLSDDAAADRELTDLLLRSLAVTATAHRSTPRVPAPIS